MNTPYLNRKVDRRVQSMKHSVIETVSCRKSRFLALAVGIFLGLLLVFFMFYQTTVWYRTHDIRFSFPIAVRLYWPIEIVEKKPLVDHVIVRVPFQPKVLTEHDIVLSRQHGEVLWKVYQLESQRGKEDYCRANHLGYGGFGVKDGDNVVCYETFERAVDQAEYWLVENGINKNLVNALCTWNLGQLRTTEGKIIPHQNCNYYQSYLTVVR